MSIVIIMVTIVTTTMIPTFRKEFQIFVVENSSECNCSIYSKATPLKLPKPSLKLPSKRGNCLQYLINHLNVRTNMERILNEMWYSFQAELYSLRQIRQLPEKQIPGVFLLLIICF